MPKLKTKKGVAKRFKLTKKGKIKYYSGGKSHLATSKKTKKIRHLRKDRMIGGSKEIKYLKRVLPYG
ncbi:MAG: 50S ribosomal protein L35 [Candidatus Omnitrophica bacterium]|nr:50S ribosomal protein L35 [Candidatus Omnitrophota bacterium]